MHLTLCVAILKNNGLPSFEDREYNKKYYGVQEERTAKPNGFQPNILGIAPMGREGRMWCWIAAASMVDGYYHPESSASQ